MPFVISAARSLSSFQGIYSVCTTIHGVIFQDPVNLCLGTLNIIAWASEYDMIATAALSMCGGAHHGESLMLRRPQRSSRSTYVGLMVAIMDVSLMRIQYWIAKLVPNAFCSTFSYVLTIPQVLWASYRYHGSCSFLFSIDVSTISTLLAWLRLTLNEPDDLHDAIRW